LIDKVISLYSAATDIGDVLPFKQKVLH